MQGLLAHKIKNDFFYQNKYQKFNIKAYIGFFIGNWNFTDVENKRTKDIQLSKNINIDLA